MSSFTSLAGKLLIAMPSISDPNFERSVVFLCAHTEQGAMGFVVNKPAPLTVFSDLLEKTELADNLDAVPEDVMRIPIRLGGPVETFRGFVLHSPDYPADDTSLAVGSSYVVSATLNVLTDIAQGRGPAQKLIALGYAGWSPGQLENEILHNGWLHCDAEPALIYEPDLEITHTRALAKLGIDPRMLSSEAGHG
ncbi:YqgE/AlgH family protein [Aestuariivirga sp.]|uniref:YqgE/AlgH family protein n=1 Tax=Aestuariivirga sp. TaxID=2650926 RepID=UPI0039E3B158